MSALKLLAILSVGGDKPHRLLPNVTLLEPGRKETL